MGQSVILTGFMGTGKTAVGQLVARRLGLPFVDMDAEIEAQAGKPVREIFGEEGEAAFRRMENQLCEELATGRLRSELAEGAVIATGGGALINPENRSLMSQRGLVICLDTSPDEILRRLGDEATRPLLDVNDPRAEIERLLSARREAYEAIAWHIDTTELSVEQTARRVVSLVEAVSLAVRYPGGTYEIGLGSGLLNHVGGALRATGIPPGTRVAIVSNDVVAPLYGAQVEEALRGSGLRPFLCVIPDGETHKNLNTATSLYKQLLANGLDRDGVVLSLGGGVTGDIAGFVAATFMRGIQFAQTPTSLLAMVDASVGGKTGVDLPEGKNLVGAFKQPACVTIDPAVLATLRRDELRSGMAEVIKHGVIGDRALFIELAERGRTWTADAGLEAITADQIAQALRVKIDIVEKDPYEQGRRAVLNLGHTVGHALETLSRFTLRHGEAVSIGMVAAARIAVTMGLAERSMTERLEGALAGWGLPVRCAIPGRSRLETNAVWGAMGHDKKRRRGRLRWVLPSKIGEVTIRDDVGKEVVLGVLRDMGAT